MRGKGQRGVLARAVDGVAAFGLGAAVGFAVLVLTGLVPLAAASGATVLGATYLLMAGIDGSPRFALAGFDPVPVEAAAAAPLPELLLTELTELLLDDRLDEEALLLDDQLVPPGENSRVIRLFDPRSLPTAGQLHERIEGHLHGTRQSPDATEELHRALSDLRSALR